MKDQLKMKTLQKYTLKSVCCSRSFSKYFTYFLKGLYSLVKPSPLQSVAIHGDQSHSFAFMCRKSSSTITLSCPQNNLLPASSRHVQSILVFLFDAHYYPNLPKHALNYLFVRTLQDPSWKPVPKFLLAFNNKRALSSFCSKVHVFAGLRNNFSVESSSWNDSLSC